MFSWKSPTFCYLVAKWPMFGQTTVNYVHHLLITNVIIGFRMNKFYFFFCYNFWTCCTQIFTSFVIMISNQNDSPDTHTINLIITQSINTVHSLFTFTSGTIISNQRSFTILIITSCRRRRRIRSEFIHFSNSDVEFGFDWFSIDTVRLT